MNRINKSYQKEMHSDLMLLVGKKELDEIRRNQEEILKRLNQLSAPMRMDAGIPNPYVTAGEFMLAVRIRRWKFNQLVMTGKIMSLKKKRKIYVPKGEIERYFQMTDE